MSAGSANTIRISKRNNIPQLAAAFRMMRDFIFL
jgi:hypothetical protein